MRADLTTGRRNLTFPANRCKISVSFGEGISPFCSVSASPVPSVVRIPKSLWYTTHEGSGGVVAWMERACFLGGWGPPLKCPWRPAMMAVFFIRVCSSYEHSVPNEGGLLKGFAKCRHKKK